MMKRHAFRVLRLMAVALVAWVAYAWLDARGEARLLLPVALVVTLAVIGLGWWRRRRRGAGERYLEAMFDPDKRTRAIREVRARFDAEAPATTAACSEHAATALLLAELLDADGQIDEARAVLEAVPAEGLPAADAAMVIHGRAVAALRAGDAEAAERWLGERPRSSGDPELDMRLELLEAAAGVERGRAEEAMEIATRIRRRAGGDADMVTEARVVRASALDALGRRDEALEVLRSLGPEVVAALAAVGPPRVRALAEACQPAD